MNKRDTQRINQIMDKFDFARVHEAMISMNWTYNSGSIIEVPSIERLKKTAFQLLNTGGSSGGFIVDRYGEGKHLRLSFVITQYPH